MKKLSERLLTDCTGSVVREGERVRGVMLSAAVFFSSG